MALSSEEPKVIKLTPPTITAQTIKQKLVCTRPMREGRFNISVEPYADKTIVNCYGQGGSGYTTLFGSVGKAIDLFKQTNPDTSKPIRVIGAGCMGLTAAIELARAGYQVAGITAKDLYELPSWRAAGYFALVSVKTSAEEQANLNEIGMNTFLAYQKIGNGWHPYLSDDAVRFMPVYCSLDTDSGVEDLETRGLIPPREYVTLDFGNGAVHPGYVKYMTYFMDTTKIMRQLTQEALRLDIPVELKTVSSFDEVTEEVIFNCAGLGGRELNQDEAMIAVRGHLIALSEDAGSEHMDYMIYSKVKQDGKDEYVYLFPKNVSVTPQNIDGTPCAGVLGGTFIPDVDKLSLEEQAEIDQKEFKRLLDRNATFFTGKAFKE
jgi:hypothetical protein